ncbi:MAG TPA: hypothetical protein VJX67_21720, partial [Blastocatellia bacterium]|nr:hypothetical protein [Blastocatellia bacterium]
MIDTLGVVIENHELAPGYRLMTLEFDDQIPVRPGQFAMLKPLGSFEPLLRRALAIYKVPAPNRISFLYQVLGRGTQALASVPSGGKIQSLLPLGNFWPLPSFSGSAGVPGSALVVAGGIGSASLLMLAKELATVGIATEVFFGAANRTSALGSGLEDFKRLGLPLTVTTDD